MEDCLDRWFSMFFIRLFPKWKQPVDIVFFMYATKRKNKKKNKKEKEKFPHTPIKEK